MAGLKTGYFYDLLAFGATGYTSQALYAPSDRDGTPLLGPGQTPYTVMGELYGEFKITDEILATVGRRGFDTPYINTQDAIMTPYTFQVYGVQGQVGSADDQKLNFGAAYVDKIKERALPRSLSPCPLRGRSRRAWTAASTSPAQTTWRARSRSGATRILLRRHHQYRRTPKSSTPSRWPTGVRLLLHAQYTDQHSVGDALLTGTSFSAHQYGFKAELAIGPALLTVARTIPPSAP